MPGPESPWRIVIADDSPAVRASVRALLERDHFDIVGEAIASERGLFDGQGLILSGLGK